MSGRTITYQVEKAQRRGWRVVQRSYQTRAARQGWATLYMDIDRGRVIAEIAVRKTAEGLTTDTQTAWGDEPSWRQGMLNDPHLLALQRAEKGGITEYSGAELKHRFTIKVLCYDGSPDSSACRFTNLDDPLKPGAPDGRQPLSEEYDRG